MRSTSDGPPVSRPSNTTGMQVFTPGWPRWWGLTPTVSAVAKSAEASIQRTVDRASRRRMPLTNNCVCFGRHAPKPKGDEKITRPARAVELAGRVETGLGRSLGRGSPRRENSSIVEESENVLSPAKKIARNPTLYCQADQHHSPPCFGLPSRTTTTNIGYARFEDFKGKLARNRDRPLDPARSSMSN